MAERLKLIQKRIIDFWNKYTTKQKALIVSVVTVVVCTVVLLAYVLTRTEYKELIACDDTKEANNVVKILDENSISYELSNNAKTISVDSKQYDAATLLLGANNISSDDITIDTLFGNSISTTESERKLKSNIYKQDKLASTIESFNGVSKAVVYISSDSADTATIFDENKDSSASIVITTNDDFNTASASTIASMVATALGNSDNSKIRVSDSNGTLLFSGTDDLYSASSSGSLLTKEEFKNELKNNRENDIRYILLKQGYDDAEVVANLDFNMDEVSELYTEYTPTEGNDQGVYKKSYEYVAENASDASGEPGTGSNDSDNNSTTYDINKNGSSSANVHTTTIDYLPNERKTNTIKEIGAVNTDNSSVSIVLSQYVVYNEEDLEKSGDLGDLSFEQYIKENNLEQVTALTVPDSIYDSVSAASGIDKSKINITAYQQPVFNFKDKSSKNITQYLPIILLVIIIAMILFVVFKSTAPVSVEEINPELSVEELLATTTEDGQLEDIEYSEKSDVRKMIEKFVDENPDAVAQLLRNWLNDDWG